MKKRGTTHGETTELVEQLRETLKTMEQIMKTHGTTSRKTQTNTWNRSWRIMEQLGGPWSIVEQVRATLNMMKQIMENHGTTSRAKRKSRNKFGNHGTDHGESWNDLEENKAS